jgi:serine protease Do
MFRRGMMDRLGRLARVPRGCYAALIVLGLHATHLAAQDVAELEEQAVRAAVARVEPSVVRIDTVGGLEQLDDVLLSEGPTTGLIVSPDGLIVSSTFNFLRQPSSILVTLPKGQRVPARIVARDHSRKLVLLQVSAPESLPVPEAAPTTEIVVGQSAIAVGRTFQRDKCNVSTGIISARHRIWGKAVQTDAKISPSNYGGPLIDLRGRVIGILAPLSPTGEHELSAADWYDGGIGFAVPLSDINRRLTRMSRGEDLHPGLLGVTLKPGDIYSAPAELIACHPKSPAYQAGLRVGDTIVAVEDSRIERQSQLRHALGPLYAGEQVSLEVLRGTERRRVAVELAKEIEPYEIPFLGILPVRVPADGEQGVAVRYVFPESAAALAGLRAADRIRKLAGEDVHDVAAVRERLAALEPNQKLDVTVIRGGTEQSFAVTLGSLPAALPAADAVPPAESSASPPQAPPAATAITIPEEPNECSAYIPASYRAGLPHGLLVVLPAPGDFQVEQFLRTWSAAAERYQLIVVAPRARVANMWLPTETTVLRKVIDHILQHYSIDRDRVVVYGSGAGGAMAYLTGFRLRDVVRGVVAVDATIPLLLARPPDNDPIERLSIVVIAYADSKLQARVQRNVDLLREMKYPVIRKELPTAKPDLDDQTRAEVLRWIDTLDKI